MPITARSSPNFADEEDDSEAQFMEADRRNAIMLCKMHAKHPNINLFMILHPRHLWLFLPAMLFFGMMAACGVTIEQSLVIEQSGGLKASYVYEIPTSAAGLLAGLQRQFSIRLGMPPNGGVLDEAAVRRQFSGIRGVYMENYSRFQLQDSQRVEFSVVALDAIVALESGAFGAFHYTPAENQPIGGQLELAMPDDANRQAVDTTHAARLAELLGGFRLTLTITVPASVHEEGSTGQPDGPLRRKWQITLPELFTQELSTVRLSW